jgi:hypothetical protein
MHAALSITARRAQCCLRRTHLPGNLKADARAASSHQRHLREVVACLVSRGHNCAIPTSLGRTLPLRTSALNGLLLTLLIVLFQSLAEPGEPSCEAVSVAVWCGARKGGWGTGWRHSLANRPSHVLLLSHLHFVACHGPTEQPQRGNAGARRGRRRPWQEAQARVRD